jgi:chromosome segregation ATPase
MTDFLLNPATIRNLSLDELMHYADEIEHPMVQRMVEIYFSGDEKSRQQVKELEDELRDLERAHDDLAWEHESLEDEVEALTDKIKSLKEKLNELVNSDHPDEIQDELRQVLERLE